MFRRLAVLLLLALAFTFPLAAQTGSASGSSGADSVNVIIMLQGTLYHLSVDTLRGPYKAGDTISIPAAALDENGDPVSAVFSFTSADPSVLRIDTVTVPGMGRAIARGTILQKLRGVDRITVKVHVEQVDTIITGWLNQQTFPPSIEWNHHTVGPQFTSLQQVRQLCTYFLWQGHVVAQNPGSPGMMCPIIASPVDPAIRMLDPLPYYREWKGMQSAATR